MKEKDETIKNNEIFVGIFIIIFLAGFLFICLYSNSNSSSSTHSTSKSKSYNYTSNTTSSPRNTNSSTSSNNKTNTSKSNNSSNYKDYDPADYDSKGNYKPVESMTQQEIRDEIEQIIGDNLYK